MLDLTPVVLVHIQIFGTKTSEHVPSDLLSLLKLEESPHCGCCWRWFGYTKLKYVDNVWMLLPFYLKCDYSAGILAAFISFYFQMENGNGW